MERSTAMSESESPFSVQADVRAPWRRYLDELAPLRPQLHRYCVRLTGNVWEGENLAREEERASAAERPGDPSRAAGVREAAAGLLARLAPRERAALVMKD